MTRRLDARPASLLLTLAIFAAGAARGQEPAAEPAAPKLAIAGITVEPARPGPDTLCRLRVRVKNDGDEIASQLGFAVRLNGQDLTVYGNQLFMYPVPAGGEAEIPLYNFWTTETSRPEMPVGGKYRVEVELREAQWMSITTEEEDGEPVETWQPLGAVAGLPVSASVTLETAPAAPAR